MGLDNNKVYLDNNYNLYKSIYNEEKDYLNKIFNNNYTIKHIGSTSIKGLLSKPIVDILVGIDNLNSINKYLIELKNRYNIKTSNEEILLIKEDEKETYALIHIIPINTNRYNNIIKFKEILINNKNILKEYELLKIELSNKYKNNRKLYTKSKSKFIEEVLKKH